MGEQPVRFADPVAAVIAWLNAGHLPAGVHAVGRIPTTIPDRMVRVVATGAIRVDLTTRDSRVTVECWALDEADAADLAADTAAELCALDTDHAWVPDGPDGWIGGPYASADPVSNRPQSVMTVVLRQTSDQ